MSAAGRDEITHGWPRRVMPEILDTLPADDPRAQRARGDLRRINRIMGARALLVRALDAVAPGAPARLVELGAGDGTLALRLARARAARWPGLRLALLDREPSVTPRTAARIEALGWRVEIVADDALAWLESPTSEPGGIFFANLFVHHFEGEALARLLGGIGARADAFVCCEPRRSRVALLGSRLLWLIGSNTVTRHDALVSVRAGFRDGELSAAWPARTGWQLTESAAGLFSHLFVARRTA